MSPFFQRAASSVFVSFMLCLCKHPLSGCFHFLAQKGGSTDGAAPHPPPYRDTLSPPPFRICQTLSLFVVQQFQPYVAALLWAGKANICLGEECISHFMGSVAFSWQSRAGGAVQLCDMQRGISRALDMQHGISRCLSPSHLQVVFYCHCP